MHTVTAVLLLTARFYSVVNVPAGDRVAATGVAANILRAAGIDVRWMVCNDRVSAGRPTTREVCLTPLNPDEVIVRLVLAPTRKSDNAHSRPGFDRLGDAYVDTATAAGSLATVYVDRVAMLARTAGVDAGTLLGRVVAHEIGHLLLGTASHRQSGLMRAEWSPTLLRRQMTNDWRFSKLDAANAREGMLRRARAVQPKNGGATPLTLPCTDLPKEPAPAICPSCPVCASLLPADGVTLDLFVEPRF